MRQTLVIGNWKMNGSLALASELIQSIGAGINDKISCDIGLCVPYIYLGIALEKTQGLDIKIGVQTVSEFSQGAYTGEIAADMLAEMDCTWVLVGHSERRQYFNEGDHQLVLKVEAAQRAGLNPVFCVGETESEKQANKTFDVIKRQVMALFVSESIDMENIVLAYEPVWAIGTGLTATPEEAQTVHAYIRELVKESAGEKTAQKIKILYGGSVKADNAQSLFDQQDIDGGLIGGASLDAKAFLAICQHAT